jgi:hypothetical protein
MRDLWTAENKEEVKALIKAGADVYTRLSRIPILEVGAVYAKDETGTIVLESTFQSYSQLS